MVLFKAVILGSLIIIGLLFLLYYVHSLETRRIYVLPKSGVQCKILHIVPMKHPDKPDWLYGVIYVKLDDGRIYIKEKEYFFDTTVSLKDWREENGNIKSR